MSRPESMAVTCPLTEAGFIRIVSNPVFSRDAVTPREAAGLLAANTAAKDHAFWPDELPLAEAIAFGNMTSLSCQVQHKSMDQGDNSAASIGSDQAITLAALTQTTWTAGADLEYGVKQGLLELIRFKYTVTASSTVGFAHIRMLNPSWLSN